MLLDQLLSLLLHLLLQGLGHLLDCGLLRDHDCLGSSCRVQVGALGTCSGLIQAAKQQHSSTKTLV